MVNPVNRRNLRKLAFLLVLAQVLLSAPMGSALAALAAPADAEHCAGMMPAGDGSCPCCPEGDQGTAACLSACATPAAANHSFVMPRAPAAVELVTSRALPPRSELSDPPVKPPPIA